MSEIKNISRRGFIKSLGLASGGLLIACQTDFFSSSTEGEISKHNFQPNLFIELSSDGILTLVASRSEMGNGVRTSLTSVIADEMEASWDRVVVKQATGDKKYGDQNTDGSRSIRYLYETMREMGAMARMMLITAAAQKWNVSQEDCYAKEHHVYLKNSTKKLGFGELAQAASLLEAPKELKFKDPKDFKYIGSYLPGIDVMDYATGKAEFGIDKRIEGMKYVAIDRSPDTFGKVGSYDRDAALAVSGVEQVLNLPRVERPFGALGGVAVVASNTWAAFKGKSKLNTQWVAGENASYDTDQYMDYLTKAVHEQGKTIKNTGDLKKGFKQADQIIESTFQLPHLVHAPMEVPNAVAVVNAEGCEVWAPTQDPQTARTEVAEYLGIEKDKVTINVTFLGGGFGRKSKPDYIVEAVAVARAIKAPAQVVWTREDDIQHAYYHTISAQYLKAGIDASGKVTAWEHRMAFPSIASTFTSLVNRPQSWEAASATNIPYVLPNMRVATGKAPAHVRIGWMRSVINIPHGFSVNVFMDELAHKAGQDPLEFRLNLIGPDRIEDTKNDYKYDTARLKHVLKTVAKNADWGKKLPKGHAQGIAIQYSFLSYAASVVEVSVVNNQLKVHQIHQVIDCGKAINKNTIESQMQGAAIFGLSLAYYGKISAKNGAIQQSNFHDYQMIRMNQAPPVHVEIIESDEKPTGVGEPGVPPIAPALVNAIFKATGKRYHSLPLNEVSDLKLS